MILRASLSIVLCLVALGIGLYTAMLASNNRALGAELDGAQRWCETFKRQNDLLAAEIEAQEFELLHPTPASEDDLAARLGAAQ